MDPRPTDTSTLTELASAAAALRFEVWGLTVLWHADPRRAGERAVLPELARRGQAARLSRGEPAFAAPGGSSSPLAETRLSRRPLELRISAEGLEIARAGSPTSLEVDGEAVEESCFLPAGRLGAGALLLLGGAVLLLLHRFDPQLDADLPRWGMVGDSQGIVAVRRAIARVADLDVPVLVRGATGSGKELVARALHAASRRRDHPFVAVNMAALPPELAAAELFGAERGAFTGADRRRPGYFSEASGGTLFLDEIGAAPDAVQPLLLRALESGEIQPLGAGGSRKVDVRLVTATDADLETAIAEHRFRAPLFHRLRGFEIRLPPLAERREDIGRLLAAFLREELDRVGEPQRLAPGASFLPAPLAARFVRAPWPGNVRELRAAVRQLVIASRGEERATVDAALEALLAGPVRDASPVGSRPAPHEPVPGEAAPGAAGAARKPADIGEDELVAAMRQARFRPHLAARFLGIPRSSIYDLIARSRLLRTAADLGRDELALALAASQGHVETTAAQLELSPSALRRRLRQLGLA